MTPNNGEQLEAVKPKSAATAQQEQIDQNRAILQEAVDLLMDTGESAALNNQGKRRELAKKLENIIGPNKG